MNLTIQIEPIFLTNLEKKAKELQMNTNDLVIKALEYFLYIERLQAVRQQLEIYALQNNFLSEEDFYNQIS